MFEPNATPLVAVPFRVQTTPSDANLRRRLETRVPLEAVFSFGFGDATAHVRAKDAWTALCEFYLEAQLAAKGQLHSLSVNCERLCEVVQRGRVLVCSWSPQHIFTVDQREFVREIERLVDSLLASTSDVHREEFVQLGASFMLSRPEFAALKDDSSSRRSNRGLAGSFSRD